MRGAHCRWVPSRWVTCRHSEFCPCVAKCEGSKACFGQRADLSKALLSSTSPISVHVLASLLDLPVPWRRGRPSAEVIVGITP